MIEYKIIVLNFNYYIVYLTMYIKKTTEILTMREDI